MSFWKKRSETKVAVVPDKPETAIDKEKEKSAEALLASGVSVESAPGSNHAQDSLLAAVEKRFGNVRSALSPGTNIQGKLSFDVAVRIDGELGGEIYSSQPIIVGPKGRIRASIETSSLIVLGKVEGDVTARDRVEVLKGGNLSGDIKAPVFVLEEEGNFNGSLAMKS